METWLIILAAVAVTLVYIVFSYLYAPFRTLKLMRRCGISGPRPVPFFGNFLRLKKMGTLKFNEELYKTYGPVFATYMGYKANVKIVDTDLLKQVMVKEFDGFVDRTLIGDPLHQAAGLPDGLLQAKAEDWKKARKTLSPTFSAMKMKMMVPLLQKSCNILVEKLGELAGTEKSVDIFKVYGSFTMESIVATAFGRFVNLQKGEGDKLTDAAGKMFASIQENQLLSLLHVVFILLNFPFLKSIFSLLLLHTERGAAFMVLYKTAISLVQARRQDAGKSAKYKDLLQLMIDASSDEDGSTPEGSRRLTDKEIVANSITFLLAGYETTSNALAYTSYLLALHPSIQDKLHAEIEEYFQNNPEASMYDATQELQYLDMVIQESLRVYPPVPRTIRACVKTTKISDSITIPEGTVVDIPVHLLHLNPKFWPDPETFDPERFTPEEKAKRPQMCHMPFGWGPRSCIGMRFALMEAKLALIEILRNYKFVQAPDTEIPLQTVLGITMAPKNGIYLRIATRD